MGKTNREKFQGCRRRTRAGQAKQLLPDYGLGTLSCLVIESNSSSMMGPVSKTMAGGQIEIMRLCKERTASAAVGKVNSWAQSRERRGKQETDRRAHTGPLDV